MKQKLLYQCRLGQGNSRAVGYIEERGAKVGAHVEIEELGGFWEVLAVGTPPIASAVLAEKQRADRNSCQSIKKK